jgi:hypothetical protein
MIYLSWPDIFGIGYHDPFFFLVFRSLPSGRPFANASIAAAAKAAVATRTPFSPAHAPGWPRRLYAVKDPARKAADAAFCHLSLSENPLFVDLERWMGGRFALDDGGGGPLVI